jgi:HAD superfamily hydrolase (TIGR01509 family)
MPKRIQHVLLDIDDTLVDSNDAHAHAWVQAMAAYGHWVPFDKVRPLIGMGADKILPELLALSQDSAEGQQIRARRKTIFLSEYLPNLHPFPMARYLLRRMHEHGLTLVVATSAEPDELQHLLRVIGPDVQDLFEQLISAKDVQHSKPDPDLVYAALQRTGAQPAASVMIGDTVYDVEAAAQVEVKTIAFRCGGWSDDHLQGAIAIYDGPADLLAHYQESPLVQGI